MPLSVIVTAYRSAETLRQCVARLRADPAVSQILVADCSELDPQLPIPVRRFPTPTPVPQMRWALLPEVSEPVVACLEGRCLPPLGWADAILEAHQKHPETPAIGGAVDFTPESAWLDRVVWFCEYGAYAPPLPDAEAADISGAHLSYKTAALRQEQDLLAANAWETLIHLRWRNAGKSIRTTPVTIHFRNGMSAPDFLRQRIHYGRGYAAARCQGQGPRRWLLGCLTPLLPFVLTLRTARAARRADFLTCLPGIFFFHAMWSAGELLGYWFGPSGKHHIY